MYNILASVIDTITENFKLGFGSFVDKRLAPYFSLETARSVHVYLMYVIQCEVCKFRQRSIRRSSLE